MQNNTALKVLLLMQNNTALLFVVIFSSITLIKLLTYLISIWCWHFSGVAYLESDVLCSYNLFSFLPVLGKLSYESYIYSRLNYVTFWLTNMV